MTTPPKPTRYAPFQRTRARNVALASCLAVLVALCALPAPAAAQPDPSNGQATGFGTITMPAYLSGPGPMPVTARIHIDDVSQLPADGHLLFGFSTLDAQAHVRLDGLETADGTAIAAEPGSSPGTASEPRIAVTVASLQGLANAGDLVLKGTAWADGNGRFHIGALAMAFDAGWAPLEGPDGPAQLFAFSWLGAKELTDGGAPFAGRGNLAPTWIPVLLLGGICAMLWWLSKGLPRRHGRAKALPGLLQHNATNPAKGPQFEHGPRRILAATPISPEAIQPRTRPAPLAGLPRPARRPRPGQHPVRMNASARPIAAPRPRPPEEPDPMPMPQPLPPIPPLPYDRRGATAHAASPFTGRPGTHAPAPRPRSGTPAPAHGRAPGLGATGLRPRR